MLSGPKKPQGALGALIRSVSQQQHSSQAPDALMEQGQWLKWEGNTLFITWT